MRQIFFVLLYLSFLFSFCESVHRKVICDDAKDITINENEIVFIETPGYPASFTDEMVRKCKFNIFGNSTVEDGYMYLTIVLATGLAAQIFKVIDTDADETYWFDLNEGDPKYYRTNSSSIIFEYGSYADDGYHTFQGYIYYEKADVKPNCDMAPISQPLFLDDENEVVYIYAPKNFNSNITCSWTFIAPKEYGFKFTSIKPNQIYPDITDALVIVANSSGYIITDIYTKSNIPYYNVDHNITVTLQTTSPIPAFNALISIVLKNPSRTFANCYTYDHDGIITWYSNLYPNNAECNYSTAITSTQQLFIGLSSTPDIFEAFADTLTFQNDDDEDSITHVDSVDEDNDVIYSVYGPYENGTTKTIHWRFLSDGSIVTQNFEFDFVMYDCVCNNNTIIVPCDDDEYRYSIIDTTNIGVYRYKDWYCANMNCTFTITVDESCTNRYIVAELYLDSTGNAFYQLISDDKLIAESCKSENCTPDYLAVIKPYSNTILHFSSGPKLETSVFVLTLHAYEKFEVTPSVIITHNVPWQSLNSHFTNLRSIFTVELSDELKQKNDSIVINYQIELYLTYIKYFDDLNLANALTVDDVNSMNLTSFVVFVNKQPGELEHYIAKAKYASTKGCRFPDTVFPLLPLDINRKSMLSTENETCQILLTRSFYCMVVKDLFAYQNGTRKEIEIYNGINDQEKVIGFNEDNAFQWQLLVFGSLYYVVKIPPFTTFYFEAFDLYGYSGDLNSITISSPSWSLMETEGYGSLQSYEVDPANYVVYNIQNITVMFTVRDYDISEDGTLGFMDDSGKMRLLTGVNQSVAYYSRTVTFVYDEPNDGYKGARIFFKAYH